MPIDYSKWKAIEVSDDEDDTHPNIDTASLFRWRHQSRLEHMAEAKQKKEELEKNKQTTTSKIADLEARLADTSISDTERKKAEEEKAEILRQEEEWKKKEDELEKEERLRPWNVDTIGHDAMSHSRINKVTDKPKELPTLSDAEDGKRMQQYFDANEELLTTLSRLDKIEQIEQYLLEHPHLCSEYASNWLTIDALNNSIETKYDDMARTARVCIIVQYEIELAKQIRGVATNTTIISSFFKKFRAADPQYLKMYEDEVASFVERLRKRGTDKREQALNEMESEDKERRIRESPGGLDPQEVFESLPSEMQDCFARQDIASLQKLAADMDEEVFAHHLRRCVDSGLWVPNAKDKADDDESAKQ